MELEKDILETIKDIQDINKELSSPNHDIEKLCSINRKAKQKFIIETSAYEISKEQLPNATYIPIDSMNVEQLISRLPFYKTLYLDDLRKNTKEYYEKILNEYEILMKKELQTLSKIQIFSDYAISRRNLNSLNSSKMQ